MSFRMPDRSIYRRILQVSIPLVASLGATTVMEFTDRLFLSHYSLDAIAAATPAGIMALLPLAIFIGNSFTPKAFCIDSKPSNLCSLPPSRQNRRLCGG